MQQLTGVDASFLYMESPTTFGHVSSLIIFDSHDTDGGGYEATKALFLERLPLLDPMRRKLVEVPFNLDHPYWIEDPDLDLDFHIRETAVAPPGKPEQVSELVSRLIARPLDRSRPLWELYVINGLEGGKIAQLTKIHHAAIDGVGGAQLLGNILDLEPDAGPRDLPPVPEPETRPSQEQMLVRGLTSLATQPYKQGRIAVRAVQELPAIGKAIDVASLAKRLPRPIARMLGQGERRLEDEPPQVSKTGGFTVPSTRFNNKIGPHRKFAYTNVSLDDVKAVKTALGVTVNDVVLGMCSGALRSYLDKHGELPEESLRCMIPVSVRTEDQANSYGNQVSGMLAALATDVADPVQRLEVIHADTTRAKESLGALPADLLTEVADFAPPAITARASRVMARTALANRIDPPFNLIISNVPGPQFPLYSGGAEMLTYIPVSAIADTQGLNITIMSYNGRCDFGIVACRDAVPDVWDLCHMLEDALEELKDVAGV
ncbi:MAG: wax ester/triacylglycerol synthase family O-acyltransferase [Acidimicrobiales bacterium]|nr:wax ester/triacylglycerol synthase family O-acyltransferase [Acidimicrobiales bacterium]